MALTSAGYWQPGESSKVADTPGTVNVGGYPSAWPPTWQLNRADRSCGHSSMSSGQWELGCKWRRWTHPLLSYLWCRNLSPCWLRCGLHSSPLLTVRIPCHSQKQAEDTNSHHNRLQGLVIWHSFQPCLGSQNTNNGLYKLCTISMINDSGYVLNYDTLWTHRTYPSVPWSNLKAYFSQKKAHFWSVSDSTSAVKYPEATYFNIAYYVFTDK